MHNDSCLSNNKAAYGEDSPIIAFATTPGSGPLTLIRCSGAGSIEIASSLFSRNKKSNHASSECLTSALGNTVIHGWIISDNEYIDDVLVSVFRSPKSYTGEDSLDICCHGGYAAGKAVLAALKKAGFRDALPGEFTFRAFMNGKMDLTKCESVMEIVSAKTDEGRRHAVSRLSGSLHKEICEIKKLLMEALSAAEIFLDYSEDEISADESGEDEAAGRLPKKNEVMLALEKLKKLSSSWQMERIYQNGITLVIAGRPNAGKSSLFNLFLKEDRSIVTDIPGTTRDWIEAWVNIQGIPIRLVDTAGLRETSDSIEKSGVERSRKLLQEADIILYLIDGVLGITLEDHNYISEYGQSASEKVLVLWNKFDIAPIIPEHENILCISAKTTEGLESLYLAIAKSILRQQTSMEKPLFTEMLSEETKLDQQLQDIHVTPAVGTERQKNLVDVACDVLEDVLEMADNGEPLDLVAPLLREAVNCLGEITGEVSTSDILEEMFSRFCVGK